MRRRLPILALAVAAFAATPAAAAPAGPDVRGCTSAYLFALATYDPESVTDYPAFLAAQTLRLANCLTRG